MENKLRGMYRAKSQTNKDKKLYIWTRSRMNLIITFPRKTFRLVPRFVESRWLGRKTHLFSLFLIYIHFRQTHFLILLMFSSETWTWAAWEFHISSRERNPTACFRFEVHNANESFPQTSFVFISLLAWMLENGKWKISHRERDGKESCVSACNSLAWYDDSDLFL